MDLPLHTAWSCPMQNYQITGFSSTDDPFHKYELVGNKIIINLKVCGCQLENKLLTYLFQISNSEPRSTKNQQQKNVTILFILTIGRLAVHCCLLLLRPRLFL